MKVDVLLGLQWGDEGKGKVVDFLTPKYDIIARFQGGPNAGHTLEFNHIKHVLHTIPSGIFHSEKKNLIGNGVVIDPVILVKEIDETTKLGVDITKNLYISKKAHLILPTHRLLDAALEKSRGKDKIGSTLKGIGPTYSDKVSRNGLRIGEITKDTFKSLYNDLKQQHIELLNHYKFDYKLDTYEKEWFDAIERLKKLHITDGEWFINNALKDNLKILAEGAQGSLLDIDYGSYPYVTSSNTLCAGVCTGLGISPKRSGNVFGIFKAYCTRVGSGPFPTELFDATGDELRKQGREFGSTTGRPRRCGWLDLVALKYTIMLNGIDALYMMKTDILDGFDSIKIATHYKIDGKITDEMPYELNDKLIPIYKELKGWKCDTTSFSSKEEFPKELLDYITYIEQETGVPIKLVSVGPNRTQTILR